MKIVEVHRDLTELRRQLTFETPTWKNQIVLPEPKRLLDGGTIKEVTESWRETWILPVLDGILEDLAAEIEKNRSYLPKARRENNGN